MLSGSCLYIVMRKLLSRFKGRKTANASKENCIYASTRRYQVWLLVVQ